MRGNGQGKNSTRFLFFLVQDPPEEHEPAESDRDIGHIENACADRAYAHIDEIYRQAAMGLAVQKVANATCENQGNTQQEGGVLGF
ncbi:MAG: hypothetical protein L6301_16445 [Desulfobacteraceae bacterium]|nr:hypothetical protein [Desulfobacteraceae bacterium]